MKIRASLLRILIFACMLVGYSNKSTAQAVLNANGPGNTYELINSVFAPGYDVVENPECVHPEFGRHIAEVFDTDLNQFVFEFYSHVTPDNDRCISFDRQRTEIKTYDQSPDSLIGTLGETVTYQWRFKIPAGFKPSSSFTHIHQVKAVGGDDDQPIFTLTPRKGTPNKLEFIYVLSGTSGSVKPAIVNLSLFEGVWVEVVEQIKVGAVGSYSISINRVSDGALLLSYSNPNIITIRPDNSFIRPKWGIYRSLNVPADLRDESIRFSDLSIQEGNVVLPVTLTGFKGVQQKDVVRLQWTTASEINTKNFVVERSGDGNIFTPIAVITASGYSQSFKAYSSTDMQPLKGNNYYRLKLTDGDERFTYSDRILIKYNAVQKMELQIYPNPVLNKIDLNVPEINGAVTISISNQQGRNVFTGLGSVAMLTNKINQQLSTFIPGVYFLKVYNGTGYYTGKFLKQ